MLTTHHEVAPPREQATRLSSVDGILMPSALAVRSGLMPQLGQSRPNGAVGTMSGLLPLATELRTSMVVRFVPRTLRSRSRRSGPSLLVTYQYCSIARAALWDFWHSCRESGFAGPGF